MWKTGTRPARGETDEAALALLARHGAQILATARRYAATPEDAEDAYQRGLEILLTKAPATSEEELVPWLKTVVKHEAYALRRQRERHSPITDDGELGDRATPAAITHDQAERYEYLRQGAEALRQLKPQEIRALLLKAEGYSYREICEITGWTYTKVNRCLTEGRQALAIKLTGIKGGVECERFVPLLSALADGEASAEELALLRPHMKSCLTCRARLKEFRATPARVAALVPPAALAATDGGGSLRGFVESVAGAAQQKAQSAVGAANEKAQSAVTAAQHKAESAVGVAQHKTAAFGERFHAATELATGQKLAAVAASAAALAGGGAAVEQVATQADPPRPPAVARPEAKPVKEETAIDPVPEPVVAQPPAETVAEPAPAPAPTPAPAPAPEPAPPPPPPPPPPDPANEFVPGGAAPVAPAPAPAAPQTGASGGFAPTGASGGGGGGAGEFAP